MPNTDQVDPVSDPRGTSVAATHGERGWKRQTWHVLSVRVTGPRHFKGRFPKHERRKEFCQEPLCPGPPKGWRGSVPVHTGSVRDGGTDKSRVQVLDQALSPTSCDRRQLTCCTSVSLSANWSGGHSLTSEAHCQV